MKNFVKAMDREYSRFVLLKAGIFDRPQIRELMKDPMSDEALSKAELSTWQSLKLVVSNFLGNYCRI